MLYFNKLYSFWSLIILIIEIGIATLIEGGFIRHTFGDVLAVMLLYCLLKSVLDLKPQQASIVALVIAYFIEFLQLTSFIKNIGLKNNMIVEIIFGNTFSITDLLAYTSGIIIVLITEKQVFKFKINY